MASWEALRDAGAARFPGARGRIPNFTGAEAAAARLAETAAWRSARVVKCNPDSPQRPVRRAALEAGKILYVAVPRLASDHPFFELDPGRIDRKDRWRASSIKGAAELGRPVRLDDMQRIDLIVTGCVAVDRRGARLGKGGGYSDLEYALLREAKLVTEDTVITTTVHPLQVTGDGEIPMTAHDFALDLVVTPAEVIRCPERPPRPAGVLWDHLEGAKREAIPALAERAPPPGWSGKL